MNTTRKQLFPAIAMLLVAAIALGTATYAWFVNNAAASVETMDFQASAAAYLQIGLAKPDGDGVKWDNADGAVPTFSTIGAMGWRGMINTADIKTGVYGMSDSDTFAPLMPASTGSKADKFFAVTSEGWNLDKQLATTFAAISAYKKDSPKSNGDVMVIPLYLRASAEMPIYLNNKDALISAAAIEGEIAGAVRVALVTDNTVKGDASVIHIFENSGVHANGSGSTTTGSAFAEGSGINNVTDGKPTFEPQGAKAWGSYSTSEGTGDYAGFAPETPGATALFTLKKDTPTLVNVYVWMEGCDFDCVSSIANQKFNINLNFLGEKPKNA